MCVRAEDGSIDGGSNENDFSVSFSADLSEKFCHQADAAALLFAMLTNWVNYRFVVKVHVAAAARKIAFSNEWIFVIYQFYGYFSTLFKSIFLGIFTHTHKITFLFHYKFTQCQAAAAATTPNLHSMTKSLSIAAQEDYMSFQFLAQIQSQLQLKS